MNSSPKGKKNTFTVNQPNLSLMCVCLRVCSIIQNMDLNFMSEEDPLPPHPLLSCYVGDISPVFRTPVVFHERGGVEQTNSHTRARPREGFLAMVPLNRLLAPSTTVGRSTA